MAIHSVSVSMRSAQRAIAVRAVRSSRSCSGPRCCLGALSAFARVISISFTGFLGVALSAQARFSCLTH